MFPGNSKTDWPIGPPTADRNRNRIVTLARSWYTRHRPADEPPRSAGARTLNGSPLGDARIMKNFARLVRFALPYKVRFGLSIACAAMVALLFFAELGAVYPLLHILFNSQNPQKWVAEKIDSYRGIDSTFGTHCRRSTHVDPRDRYPFSQSATGRGRLGLCQRR